MHVSIESRVYASINIGGTSVPFITDAVVTMWIVTLVIALAVVFGTRRLQVVPAGAQKWMEALVDFVNGLTASIGEHARHFAPFICTVLLFLAVSNIIAIFNVIPSGSFLAKIFNNPSLETFEFQLEPPTKNINVTACLAIVTIGLVIFSEFRYKGFRGWLRGFYKPSPISAFVKLLDYIVRPLSLCLRLFGNILGGYISMTLLYSAIPLVLPVFVSLYLDLFDGLLQAYVFVFLTVMYLSESVEEVT